VSLIGDNQANKEVTTILSGIISPAMEPATIQWNEMVQRRVGETSSMLDQIKGIKMMGLTDFFVHTVQGLRVQELKVSARFRWLLVHFTTLGKPTPTCLTSLTM